MNTLLVENMYESMDRNGPDSVSVPKRAVWNPLAFIPENKPEKKVFLEKSLVRDIRQITVENLVDSKIAVFKTKQDESVHGFEAGDDRVDFSADPTILALGIAIQELVFKMRTSKDATFISARWYNFCGVTTFIPQAKENNLNYAKKTNTNNLCYVDSAMQKIILPIKKSDDSDYSSTKTGKSQMLAMRMRSATSYCRERLDNQCFFADATLKTRRAPDPKYLPVVMGGCNVPDLFGNPWNSFAYCLTYKGGMNTRIMATAIEECRMTISRLESGIPAELDLCKRLRLRGEYLHGTWKAQVAIPPKDFFGEKSKLPEPLYERSGSTALVSSFELRLRRAKMLITDTEAGQMFDKYERLAEVLMGYGHTQSIMNQKQLEAYARRDDFDGSLFSNVNFRRLLDRVARGNEIIDLKKEGFVIIDSGRKELLLDDLEWVSKGRGEIYTLHDIPDSSAMYARGDLSLEETLKVPGVRLTPMTRNYVKEVESVAKVGLWQCSEDFMVWAEKVTQKLINAREEKGKPLDPLEVREIYGENREFISDDPYILARAIEDTMDGLSNQTIVLISSDKKLARKLSLQTGNFVVRLEPSAVVIKLQIEEIDAETVFKLSDIMKITGETFYTSNRIPKPKYIYTDTGSEESNLMQMSVKQDRKSRIKKHYFRDLTYFSSESGERECIVREYLLDNYAQVCEAEIYWPNTQRHEFTATLASGHEERKYTRRVYAETPRRWLMKYIKG